MTGSKPYKARNYAKVYLKTGKKMFLEISTPPSKNRAITAQTGIGARSHVGISTPRKSQPTKRPGALTGDRLKMLADYFSVTMDELYR